MAVVNVTAARPGCKDHGSTWSQWDWIERAWVCQYGTALDPVYVGSERPCEKVLDVMGGSRATVLPMTSF